MHKFAKALLKEDVVKLPYGCIMVTFALPKWQWFVNELIDPNDLKPQRWMEGKAMYDQPHCSILYGLAPNVTIDEVRPLLMHLDNIDVEFTGISCFETERCDVVKFDCESPQLRALSKIIRTLPHEDPHSTYNIHATIAYVNKGEGEKYIKKITPFTLKPDGYLNSSPDGASVGFIV